MNRKIVGLGIALACLVAFGSCKPKQSAYKSVYESAKEREMEENATTNSSAVSNNSSTTTPSYSSSAESVRREKIKPVSSTDAAGLKAYSVVIAAMGMKPNAESLKQRIENNGYNVILVQNDQDMYRVIIASCDTKEEAVAKKNEILNAFLSQADAATLKGRYGIPFNDWWILQREY
ncbi:MAG: SPOR domain-containing protein [Dysgonomonas sp.]